MLLPNDITLVTNEFAACVSAAGSGDVRQAVNIACDAGGKDMLVQLPTNLHTISDQAQWVIEYCLSDRWTKNPSLLESILSYMINRGQNVARISPILLQVKSGYDPNPDPYKAQWLVAGRPFLNRHRMRTLVKDFLTKNDRPILLINGDEKTGKSYSLNFFDYLMECQNSISLDCDRLEAGTGPTYEPQFLAEQLTLSMDRPTPMPEESGSLYAGQLARWIVGTAIKQSTMSVMVLDGFGRPDSYVHPQTRELIAKLIGLVGTGRQRQRVRLVLIDYYLAVDPALVLPDILNNNRAIIVEDVMACLIEHNRHREQKKRPLIDPHALQMLANKIVGEATTGNEFVLPKVYHQLYSLNEL
jgi:hypothetical protein